MKRLAFLTVGIAVLFAAACIDPSPALPSATQNRNGNATANGDAGLVDAGNSDAGPTADGGKVKGDGGTNTDAGTQDAGTDAGMTDAGMTLTPGLTILTHGNALPAPWMPDISSLAPSGAGPNAMAYVNQLVLIQGPISVYNPSTPPCPVTSANGSFCDGFQASVAGGSTNVNYYEFLGTSASCSSQYSDGSTLGNLVGVWQDDFVSEGSDKFAVALTSCDGLNGSITGGTTTAPASSQIAALLASYPSDGRVVSVSGLVIAAHASTRNSSFSFIMVDPVQPSPMVPSGIKVYHPSGSTVTATVPAVGDYVTVTGSATAPTTSFQELNF